MGVFSSPKPKPAPAATVAEPVPAPVVESQDTNQIDQEQARRRSLLSGIVTGSLGTQTPQSVGRSRLLGA